MYRKRREQYVTHKGKIETLVTDVLPPPNPVGRREENKYGIRNRTRRRIREEVF